MSSDRSAVALERLALSRPSPASGGGERGDRLPADAPAHDLAQLASALARVEALIAAGADQNADAAAAVERIADIAFVLHEREVEPSLCDALDAAMREISAANARNRVSVQRAHEAAELLRALARRIETLIALQAQPRPAWAPAGAASGVLHGRATIDELECADEFPAPARLFDSDLAEDGAFAQTIAALAQSLPERPGAAPAPFPAAPANGGAASEVMTHSHVEPAKTDISRSALPQAGEAANGAGPAASPHEGAQGPAVPVCDAADHANSAVSAAEAAVPDDTHHSIDPDEDPGDLFEPTPGMRPAADVAAPVGAMTANGASVASAPPRDPAGVPRRGGSKSAANDPLASIRALSEEELIALFS